jgi:hypothetical protein
VWDRIKRADPHSAVPHLPDPARHAVILTLVRRVDLAADPVRMSLRWAARDRRKKRSGQAGPVGEGVR